jgi:sodium/bile acid cotransporter 7
MKLKPDWFLLGMGAAVVLAWLAPGPGSADGWLHPALLVKGGVALIFFLHGLLLSFAALRAGTLRWPLHLVVQGGTFLLFPLLGLLVLAGAGAWLTPDLRLGVFFLCALPSTVSSSVALTATARGNVPAAVFNATLSNLLGVFLTPLWVGLMVEATGHTLPLGEVVTDLVCWLVLPLIAGQLVRPWLGQWAAGRKRGINRVDRGVILVLVYTSFCDSVRRGVWRENGVWTLGLVVVIALGLFFIALWVMRSVSRLLGFSRADEIAAIFCGSKKTLASGVPMAQLIFGAHPGMGLILLPIMIYHPLQLMICSVLAGRWAKRAGD